MMSSSQKIAVGSWSSSGQADLAGVVDADRGQRRGCVSGSSPASASTGWRAASRRWKVGASKAAARWPMRRWPRSTQVLEGGGRPALGVEANRGAPGASASIITTCGVGARAPRVRSPRTAGSRRPVRRAAPRTTGPPSDGRSPCRPARPCTRPPAAARWAPRRTRLKNGLVTSGTSSATAREGPAAAPGRRRRAVAQLAGAAANALLGRLGHAALALAGEDERDGRLRHAGAASDVDARHAVRGGALDVRNATTRARGLTMDVIRTMLIRMTGIGSTIAAFLAGGAVAGGGLLGPARAGRLTRGAGHRRRSGRDGRELWLPPARRRR